jgi:uncharacterized protein YecT (DUF1311 family)
MTLQRLISQTCRRRLKVLIFLPVVATISLPQVLFSASFDCRKASTFVEEAICNDAILSRLDDALGENYRYMKAANIGDGALNHLVETQRQWLKNRNRCQTRNCIFNAYISRVDEVCDYPVISGIHPGCTTVDAIIPQTEPTGYAPIRIQFPRGGTGTSWTGSIREGRQDFILNLGRGQAFSVMGGDVYTWSVITPNGQELGCHGGSYCPPGETIWSLPATGDYRVVTEYRMSSCANCQTMAKRKVTVMFEAR